MDNADFYECAVKYAFIGPSDDLKKDANLGLLVDWYETFDKASLFPRVFFACTLSDEILDLSRLNMFDNAPKYDEWVADGPDEVNAYMNRTNSIFDFINYYNDWGASVLCTKKDVELFDSLFTSMREEYEEKAFYEKLKDLKLYEFAENVNQAFLNSHKNFDDTTINAVRENNPFNDSVIMSDDVRMKYAVYCEELDYSYEIKYKELVAYDRAKNKARAASIRDIETFYENASIADIFADIVREIVPFGPNKELLSEIFNKKLLKEAIMTFNTFKFEMEDIDAYYSIKNRIPKTISFEGNTLKGLYSTARIHKLITTLNHMDRYGYALISDDNRVKIATTINTLFEYIRSSVLANIFSSTDDMALSQALFGCAYDCVDRADYYFANSSIAKYGLVDKYLRMYAKLDIFDSGLDVIDYSRFNTVKCFNNEIVFFLKHMKSKANLETLKSSVRDWSDFTHSSVMDIGERYRSIRSGLGSACRDDREVISIAALNVLKNRMQNVISDEILCMSEF